MYYWDIDNTATYNNKMGRYKTKSESDFINHFLNSPKKILDIGGGSGRFAIPLKELGHDVTVIDLNEHAIKLLKSKNPSINCINDDFLAWKTNHRNNYDLVLAIEVLLYVKNWHAFFSKVYNLLSNDGLFIFTATNKNSWRTILQKIKDRNQPDYGYSIYSYETYKKIIRETNFVIEKEIGFLWIPFKINSNSKFVDIFAWIEKKLKFNKFLHQSPWLLFAVKKA